MTTWEYSLYTYYFPLKNLLSTITILVFLPSLSLQSHLPSPPLKPNIITIYPFLQYHHHQHAIKTHHYPLYSLTPITLASRHTYITHPVPTSPMHSAPSSSTNQPPRHDCGWVAGITQRTWWGKDGVCEGGWQAAVQHTLTSTHATRHTTSTLLPYHNTPTLAACHTAFLYFTTTLYYNSTRYANHIFIMLSHHTLTTFSLCYPTTRLHSYCHLLYVRCYYCIPPRLYCLQATLTTHHYAAFFLHQYHSTPYRQWQIWQIF